MKWFMCLLTAFLLWILLFWSPDLAVLGAGDNPNDSYRIKR